MGRDRQFGSRQSGLAVTRLGAGDRRFADLYHYLLTASWPLLMLLITAIFAAMNAMFALVYMTAGGIDHVRRGSFVDAFFFSVQTMATVGYGGMVPRSFVANAIVSAEVLVGLAGLAMMTGLVFAKFSRPTARVRFSRVAAVSRRDGVPSLMFRMANVRGNRIVEAIVHVILARQETTREGEAVRRFYDLGLVRDRNPIFGYTWTAIHPLDERSPLFGMTAESMRAVDAELVVSLTGLDDTFSQTVHARHSYTPSDIVWGARFVDILKRTSHGGVIDYSRFDDTMPTP